jgi:sugar phosphate isomerase/epimerase
MLLVKMDRRLFLKNTAQFGAAISILGLAASMTDMEEPPSGKPFFKLSLAQWSLHKAILESKTLSPLDFAKKARMLGFDGIEYVSQLYELGNGSQRAAVDKLAKELLMRSRDNDMQNVLIMIDGEGELAAKTKGQRNEAIVQHSKWIDAAAALGCHSVRVNLFGEENESDFESWKSASMDGLGRLSEYAAKSKINVIVENHGGLSSDAAKLVEVIKAINLSNCGTLPDFGNFCTQRKDGQRWGTDCIQEYDKYKGVSQMMPFAKGVSAKSYDFDASGNETTIDYELMLRIVRKSGYKGYIGVEYEGSRLNEEEGIKATKALLLKLAGNV